MSIEKAIRKLFFGEPCGVDEGKTPEVVDEVVAEWKPGEPVENMVRAFAKDHRRFKIVIKKTLGPYPSKGYTITDRQNGEVFKFLYNGHFGLSWYARPDWMTEKECVWGFNEIQRISMVRRDRLLQIREQRRNRELNRERNRIVNLYKED